jgi:hypothetical protein
MEDNRLNNIPTDLLIEAHALNALKTRRARPANPANPFDSDHVTDLYIRIFSTSSELDDLADTYRDISVALITIVVGLMIMHWERSAAVLGGRSASLAAD